MSDSSRLEFETLQVHGGHIPDPITKAWAPPIRSSVAFTDDSQDAIDLLRMNEPGYFHTRIGNPTIDVFEKRMAVLEGGAAAVATASGASALLLAISNIADIGDNIVSSSYLFIGTYFQFKETLKKYGITVKFIRGSNPEDFKAAIDENTKAIVTESISNPQCDVAPMPELAKIAHDHGIPLIVDNTFGMGGYLIRPISLGADIVVHSATKWIGGHGTTVSGVVIDSGKFDWTRGKFPTFTSPCHGTIFSEKFGSLAYAVKLRAELLTNVGPTLNPFGAFLVIQGLETLSLRAQRHCDNALALATWLENHPKIESVSYLGLENHPSHLRAKELLRPNAYGSVLCFTLKCADHSIAVKAVGELRIACNIVNLGDAKTLVTDSWTLARDRTTEEAKQDMNLTRGLFRVSVGIENIKDLIADFAQAFETIP